MRIQNSLNITVLTGLAVALAAGPSNAGAGERSLGASADASAPAMMLAAGEKASSRASAHASASSRAAADGKNGGCEVETSTRAEVRQGNQHRLNQDHDRQVQKGGDCGVHARSHSRAELGRDVTGKRPE